MSFNQTVNRLHTSLTQIFQQNPEYAERYQDSPPITWSWVAIQTAQLMGAYPSGLTIAIVLAELETLWERHCLLTTNFKFDTIESLYDPERSNDVLFLECQISHLEYKHDTIWLATLKDESSRDMDMFLPPKCNDWINNRLSPFLKDFSKDRKIRFVCPRQMNTPLLKHYYNDSLSRSDRVFCYPPSQECLWKLESRDGPWIKDVFRDTFATVILPQSMAAAPPSQMSKVKRHRLWVKVIHIEQSAGDLGDDQERGSQFVPKSSTRKDIYIVDKSDDTEPALLSLYDQQIYMCQIIQKGDYLGIFHPVIACRHTESQTAQTDIIFECGPETMLFIMSNNDATEAGMIKVEPESNQSSVNYQASVTTQEHEQNCLDNVTASQDLEAPASDFWQQQQQTTTKSPEKCPIMGRDDEGLMDCLTHVPRLMINDLEPNMLNITISGRVIAKANNSPFLSEGKRMDRFAMRIEDESGKMDVTLWEDSGIHAKNISIGQRILLTGLTTSVQHKSIKGKTTWYINGSTVCGTKSYNLSTFDCLLNSTDFVHLTPLHKIQGGGQWETEATIVDWKVRTNDTCQPNKYANECSVNDDDDDGDGINLGDYITASKHRECMEMLQGDYCCYCGKKVDKNDKLLAFRSRKPFTESESEKIGWIEWRLDNGQGILYANGCEEILLGFQAAQFKTTPRRMQTQLLDSVIGKQCVCSISCVGSQGYTIDRLTFTRQYHSKCTDLLNVLSFS
ncbi:hypothetical protein BC941DRAFT_442835 [Chlamydoabsidia padenii]|nr:hypothetical protein BC941DRAFT_442835 [Chlamydoabsidia padenii]